MKTQTFRADRLLEQQIKELAEHWQLPPIRYNTPVIRRAVAAVWRAEGLDKKND